MAYLFTIGVTNNHVSDTPNTCKAFIALKALLVSCGWTVVRSGTGTGGTTNTGDLVTTPELLYGAAVGTTKNFQWFILRHPTTTFEICFQRTNMTDTSYWRIKISAGGFGTGGSPSATQTPTATDQVTIWGSTSTDASPTGAYFYGHNANHRWHFCASNAEPYNFYWLAHRTGEAIPLAGLALDHLKSGSYPAGDTAPWVIHAADSYAYQRTGVGEREYAPGVGNYGVFGFLGSPSTSSNCVFLNGGWNGMFPGGLGTNPWTGKDDSSEIVYARASNFTPPTGLKGVGTMMRWMGITRSFGVTLSVSTSKDRICIGHVTLPWDGSVPNI